MIFRFVVEVEVEHAQGKFVSREEIAESIAESIDSANPGEIESDEGGLYEVQVWETSEEPVPRRKKPPLK